MNGYLCLTVECPGGHRDAYSAMGDNCPRRSNRLLNQHLPICWGRRLTFELSSFIWLLRLPHFAASGDELGVYVETAAVDVEKGLLILD